MIKPGVIELIINTVIDMPFSCGYEIIVDFLVILRTRVNSVCTRTYSEVTK